MTNLFQPATKQQARARVAFSGPSGSGKTYWALLWAEELAAGGKIAVVDTERGSASLYADRFTFDVLQMAPPYHPDRLVEALQAAEQAGYAAVVIDSLTHFWSGPGGTLEIVDQASGRFKGNSHAAWQVGTPIQQRMIDTILAYDGHVLTTMRSKTEWVMEEGQNGRVSPKKVGLSPQQRADIEYEFTLFLEIEVSTHRAAVSKTRFDGFADRVFNPDEAREAAQHFKTWLGSGVAIIDRNTRDSIQQRMDRLDAEQRDYLRTAWRENNLPRLISLTEDRRSEVDALLTEAENIGKPPTPVIEPEPDDALVYDPDGVVPFPKPKPKPSRVKVGSAAATD